MEPNTERVSRPAVEEPAGRKPGRLRKWLRRIGLGLAFLLGLVLVVAAVGGLWLRYKLRASLPELEGERRMAGLAAPATVERDAMGIPTIQGASRRDVAFAEGYVHAQDRLFQMDLLRRQSAGELSELFGPATVPMDRLVRVHRFRTRAARLLQESRPEEREMLEAYARGVNAGRAALGGVPFEYLAMRAEPAPWRAEDSFLVLFTMFMQLQDEETLTEGTLTRLRESVPPPLFDFLTPQGTVWDSPMVGGRLPSAPLPGPEVCKMQARPTAARPVTASLSPDMPLLEPREVAGSNGWIVAGSHTANGGALLANELHLGLMVPNFWYRASLSWPDGAGGRHKVTGVTLPGAPAMVLGSNGRVAWGVTASVLDTTDVITLEVDAASPGTYRTPEGPRPFQRHREVIKVKGGEEQVLDVEETIWGPVTGKDWKERPQVLRWVAYEPGAADWQILGLETAATLEQALDVAHRSGVPALNVFFADAGGRIAWTILGRVPRRTGFDGLVAQSWADGSKGWNGLLPPEEVPQIVDPEPGRIWNGNNRSGSPEMMAKLGGRIHILGARARQIRDGLFALERATAEDMRKIQLDDRALFLQRWREHLLTALTPEAIATDPRRGEMREAVENWGGRAAADSTGYRMVRGYRLFLSNAVVQALLSNCGGLPQDFPYLPALDTAEEPLWALVSQQPAHLLDPRFTSWQQLFVAAADAMLSQLPRGPIKERTWGEFNTTRIQHPVSQSVPFLGRWLDMPRRPMSGDANMPRVMTISFGPTLRMVVSPGREQEGFFHMPGGQSGHPLSEHYADGFDAWAEGKATPFLPGPAVKTLRLVPEG